MPAFEGGGTGMLFVEYEIVFPSVIKPGLRKSKSSTNAHQWLHLLIYITELTEAFKSERGGKRMADEL